MPDQPVREIQLGGKQLVFLFMASVVLAVAIFLLGISVGRGVHSANGAASSDFIDVKTDDRVVPPPDIPATQTTAADSIYHDQLQGATPPAGSAPAPAPAVVPPKAGDEPPTVADDTGPGAAKTSPPPATASQKVSQPAPAKPETKPVAEPAKAAAPATVATGTWFVIVDSFRSRENADRQTAKLKAKNYPAAVSTSAGLYRVRVGPFAQRADAERVRQRLQREEGLKPSIQH
jgi:cell division septation protein DedD